MKKIVLSMALVLTSAIGFSQESFAVKGGLNLNNVTGKNFKTDNNLGFHVGVTYQNDFSNVLALETGVFFDTRGAKESQKNLGIETSSSTNVYSLTVPVLAKAKIEVENITVFLNAGPFMNVGLSGKSITKIGNIEEKSDVEFGDDKYNRFGFGLNVGAGVELNKFVIGAGYDMGLTEIAKDSKSYQNAIKISLGYKF